MTKRRWKGYMQSFESHIDPERKEQLKWLTIGNYSTPERSQSLQYNWRVWDTSIDSKRTQFKARLQPLYYPERGILWYTERQLARKSENKVRRILKLLKSLNQGNKDADLKTKPELIQLTEVFSELYESLNVLHDYPKVKTRKSVRLIDEDGSPSMSSSDVELFYRPDELNRTRESSSDVQMATDSNHHKPDTLNMEDTVLQAKLTSTSEANQSLPLDFPSSFSQAPESREVVKDLGGEAKESESTKQELIFECAWLKRKLIEKEDELLSLMKKHQISEKERLSQINQLEGQVANLKFELETLSTRKKDCDKQVECKSIEAKELEQEISRLRDQILELEATSRKKEDQFSAFQKKFQAEKVQEQVQLQKAKQDSSQSLTQLEKKNIELTKKIAEQQKTVTGLENIINPLKEENKQVKGKLTELKSSFQAAERKTNDMAEELRKQFEDNLVILSRRIRVAEQVQLENREWYRKKKAIYEQENKDLKRRIEQHEVGMRNVKDMSLTANDTLASLDTVALKFEEFTANFLNRISKSSCELKFAKDWVMRKNKSIYHVEEDLACLLSQLDEKEAEILLYREKVWKSENRLRELEKIIKEQEDCMLGLKEEKREAIRQLCVWIDYHRSRSDYYKKSLTDITAGYRRTT